MADAIQLTSHVSSLSIRRPETKPIKVSYEALDNRQHQWTIVWPDGYEEQWVNGRLRVLKFVSDVWVEPCVVGDLSGRQRLTCTMTWDGYGPQNFIPPVVLPQSPPSATDFASFPK